MKNRNKTRTLFTAGLSFSLLLFTLSNTAVADDQLTKQLIEELSKLNKRLTTLENRLDAIETKPEETQQAESVSQETKYLKEDVEEIFERLDTTEKKTLMDRVNLGVSMRTRVDNMEWEENTPGKEKESSNDNFWSSRFRLRMSADVTENIKFHGRFSVNKNWNDYDYNPNIWGANSGSRPTDSSVKLDRAYFDLFFRELPVPLALTIGRQPTVGGIPEHLKDDTAARSTYPALIFDREVDAINLTAGLSKWTGLRDSAFRVMYGKFLQPDNDSKLYLDDKGEDVDMLWLQGETKLAGAFDSTSVALTYLRNWDMPGGRSEAITSQPGSLGWNEQFGVTILSENPFDKGLDLFASIAGSKGHASGDTIKADLNGDGKPETYGMLTDDGKEDKSGTAFYVGARYRLPTDMLNGAKIGVEYNQASQYWWAPLMGSEDPFNKLAARGNAWEIYYLQPFLEKALFRVGWLNINYDYESRLPGPIGEPKEVDQQLSTLYFLIDVNF